MATTAHCATLALMRAVLNAVLPGKITSLPPVAPGQNKVDDDPRQLGELLSLFNTFTPDLLSWNRAVDPVDHTSRSPPKS